MGKSSRDKGSRFERRVAKLFGEVFNRKLRRTPLSGGHHIKCDIYDPENDDFPYYIECKFHKDFSINSIINCTSPLFKFHKKAFKEVEESHQAKKYKNSPIAIVVFKGGHFNEEMVLVYRDDNAISSCECSFYVEVHYGSWWYSIVTLKEFLNNCSTKPLEII
jgi:hypothetical protein